MVSESELKEQFQALGIEVNQEVADYCFTLCTNQNVTEQELVETWVAFTLSELDGAMPTIQLIQQMEKKHFSHKKFSTPKHSKPNTPVSIYSSTKQRTNNNGLLDLNTTPKGKSNFIKRDKDDNKKGLSPASFSPNVITPSAKYTSRSNSGQTVMSYSESAYDWKVDKSVSVNPVLYPSEYKLENFTCMHDSLLSMGLNLVELVEKIAQFIKSENNLSQDDNSADTSIYYGRVLCDDEKLNLNRIIVQENNGLLEVNMSELNEFSLFPGQVIVFEGKITGKCVTATKLYSSALLPLSDRAPDIVGPLQIIVAAGPFTEADTMSYEPLNDLLDYVSVHNPNLLFLVGPLIDTIHKNVFKGDLAECFNLFYSRLLHNISCKVPETKVYYVTNSKDIFSIPVFPTPPNNLDKISDHNITVLPDPAVLNINGLFMGITATDTLLHLGKKEISNGSNRLGRLAGHLLKQQSFYPLYPPDPEVNLDIHLWSQHASLQLTPHLLITPSGLHHFIKVVDGCVVINPERLVKGLVGGTFARIEVRPQMGDEKWTPASHISSEIIKI